MKLVTTRPRVLVTGANGYIGTHVVAALRARGAQVVATYLPGTDAPPADDPEVSWLPVDIFQDDVMALTGPIDSCVHLAWQAGFVHNDPVHMLKLSDHFRFLDQLATAGVGQLAVLGSMHEVGYHEGPVDESTPTNPLSLYGVAKNALREALLLRFAGTGTVVQWLRCFYIYGDDERGQSIFAKLTAAEKAGQATFPFTTGKNKFDFIEVSRLGKQIAACVLQDEVAGVINCCSGEPVSLADQVESYIRENGFSIRLEYGAFPDRPYDSPATWGDATKINAIMKSKR